METAGLITARRQSVFVPGRGRLLWPPFFPWCGGIFFYCWVWFWSLREESLVQSLSKQNILHEAEILLVSLGPLTHFTNRICMGKVRSEVVRGFLCCTVPHETAVVGEGKTDGAEQHSGKDLRWFKVVDVLGCLSMYSSRCHEGCAWSHYF